MKHHYNIEIILLSKQASTDGGQKAFVKWLTTIFQTADDKQRESIKKLFLRIWEDTPQFSCHDFVLDSSKLLSVSFRCVAGRERYLR
jgi:hypothetical protein